jgi:hypothetical protein
VKDESVALSSVQDRFGSEDDIDGATDLPAQLFGWLDSSLRGITGREFALGFFFFGELSSPFQSDMMNSRAVWMRAT